MSAPLLYINTGTGPNSGNGDPLRIAFNKINSNFKLLGETTYTLFNGSATFILSTSGSVTFTNGTKLFEADGNFYIGSSDTGIDWAFNTDGTTVFPPGYILPGTTGQPGQTLVLGSDNLTFEWQLQKNSTDRLVNNGYTVRLNNQGSLIVPDIIESGNGNSLIIEINTENSYWWSQYGDLGFNVNYDRSAGSVYDSDGNLYVVGSVTTSSAFSTSTNEVTVVIKYDPMGNLLWNNSFSVSTLTGSTQLIGEAITLDNNGNIFVIGNNSNVTSSILKFDSNGNLLYQQQIENSYVTDISIDSQNNIYILGDFPFTGNKYTSTGFLSIISKFDNNLNSVWSEVIALNHQVNEPYQGYGAGAVVVQGNYVYVNGGANDNTNNWMWTAKLDLNGNTQWIKDGRDIIGMGLAVDTDGNVYSACTSDQEDGATRLIKYNSTGSVVWITTYNYNIGGGDVDVTYANDGYLYLSGVVYNDQSPGTALGQSSLLHWAKIDPDNGHILVDRYFGNTNTNILVGNITNVTTSTSSIIVTVINNQLSNGAYVLIGGVAGTTQLNGNYYYVNPLTSNDLQLFEDFALTLPVSGSGFSPYSTSSTGTLTKILGPGQEDIWYYRGHRLGGVYKNSLAISAYSYTSTSTNTTYVPANFLTLQLPTDGSNTGTYGVYTYGNWNSNPVTTTTNYLTTGSNIQFNSFTGFQYTVNGNVVSNNITDINTYTAFTYLLGTNGVINTWTFSNSGGIIFPDNTVQYTAWTGSGGNGNGSVVQSATPPIASTTTLWYDTIGGRTYVYDNGWVDSSPSQIFKATTSTIGSVAVDGVTIVINSSTGVISSIANTSMLVNANNTLTLDSSGNLFFSNNIQNGVINWGGFNVHNSPEIAISIDWSAGPGTTINNSEIALLAGNGGISSTVYGPWAGGIGGSGGPTLVSVGVENADYGKFAGMVAIDPNVTSPYAVGLDANKILRIGYMTDPGAITTLDYTAGLGVSNTVTTIVNGIFVNSTLTTIMAGATNPTRLLVTDNGLQIDIGIATTASTWMLNSNGNLVFPDGTVQNTANAGNSILINGRAVASLSTSGNFTFGTTSIVGPVSDIALTNGGSGYFSPNTTVGTTGGTGVGLTVSYVTGHRGSPISSVSIINPGTGYSPGDTITIDGGTGGTFVVTNITTILTGNLYSGGTGYFGPNSALTDLAYPLGVFTIDVNSDTQIQIQNQSNGNSASGDFVVTSNIGTNFNNYIDLGINSSGYNTSSWTISGPNDGYLYVDSGNLTLGTDAPGYNVAVHVGGLLAENIVAVFTATSLNLNVGVTFPDNTVQTTAWLGSTSTSTLVNGSYSLILGPDGTLTLPGSLTGDSVSIQGAPVTITITDTGGVWSGAVGTYTRLSDIIPPKWAPANYNPSSDSSITYDGGWQLNNPTFGHAVYVNTGTLTNPSATWDPDTQFNLGSGNPAGAYTYSNWTFNTEDGTLTAPGPIYGGSKTIGLATPAPLNLNNTGPVSEVKTQLNLINTAGNADTGSAIDFFTYVDQGNGLPGARLQARDDDNYSANFSIALKGKGNTGNNGLTTAWTFGSDGSLTFPSGAGFANGDSGQLKTNDGVTLSLDFRDSSGRGFFTNSDGVTLRSNGSKNFVFGSDGNLTLPRELTFSAGAQIFEQSDNIGAGWATGLNIRGSSANDPIRIYAYGGDSKGYNAAGIQVNQHNVIIYGNSLQPASNGTAWTFNSDGSLTFPDSSVQPTAWTGSTSTLINTANSATVTITTAPSSLVGSSGDVPGLLAFDNSFIYYSTGTYTRNSYIFTIYENGGSTGPIVHAGSSDLATSIVAQFGANNTGWTFGGITTTNITYINTDKIQIDLTSNAGYNSTTATLIAPVPTSDIWKQTPWDATTNVKSGFNATGPAIKIDNAQFSFNNIGNPTVGAVSGTWSGPWTAVAQIWDGVSSYVTTNYGSPNATWSSIASYSIGVTFANAGDQVIGYFTDGGSGHIYKTSWFASTSSTTTNCTITVEKLI